MEALQDFRQQYGDLHDAMIWSICYRYSRSNYKRVLEMEVECHQIEGDGPYPWQSIKLYFVGVNEFMFFEKLNTTNQIIFAANYLFQDGCYYFDFDYATEDVLNVTQMRETSTFHLTCKEFAFEVINTIS
ncbi:hypothetical protein [uncultured Hymenobacter sp.]|uniref:hypothetical protein n=1 Tax=uncultured Hymenobacter sp. TaxID=170016 RepID=UPI0035C98066